MHLERLDIQGFKSFARKTTFTFSKGVTAIVGPNGSGKSNVADAVRWVLGEQSLKHIRGKKSEDIIFSGSESFARLGFAEVSITFDNTDHAMPIEYDQVQITRRMYRNGDGEYFLNKSKVRLLDIAELLAKAGFAQRSYGVISQDMIASLVTATPKERLELFEDASGVTQFKLKRDQAVRKLETSTQNMAQVNTVMSEIEPHLQTLRKQAKKAEKQKKLVSQLRQLQESYFSLAWAEIFSKELEKTSQMNALQEKLEVSAAELAQLKSQAGQQQASQEQYQSRLRELQDKIQSAQEELNKRNGELARIDGLISVEQERGSHIDMTALESRIGEIEKRTIELRATHESVKAQISELDAKRVDAQEAFRGLQSQKIQLNQKLKSFLQDAKKLGAPELTEQIKEIYLKHNSFIQKLASTRSYDELMSLYQLATGVNNELLAVLRIIQGAPAEEDSPRKFDNQQQVTSMNEALTEIFDKEARVQDSIHKNEIQIASFDAQLASLSEQLDSLGKEHVTALNNRDEARALVKKDKNPRLVGLEQQKHQLLKEISRFDKQKDIFSIRLANAKNEQSVSKLTIVRASEELELKEKEHERLKDIAHMLRVEQERAVVQKENFLQRMNLELDEKLSAHVLRLESVSEKVPIDTSELETLEQEMNFCDRQMLSIGATIEPQVIDEYKAMEERHQFLTDQYEDLDKASGSLGQVIAQLDTKIDVVFRASFGKINEQFQEFFKLLFNGGSAKLTLEKIEEHPSGDGISVLNNMLGVDIKATPPGKKLKNVSVLSGGEKALTSLALICAILSTTPSPFVMLDEVDAALDEANAARFAEIMLKLTDKSQFIVITHSRQTMNIANALYGITMQKDGISKLLSIKFDTADKLAQNQPKQEKLASMKEMIVSKKPLPLPLKKESKKARQATASIGFNA